MAVLTTQQREDAWRAVMSSPLNTEPWGNLTKDELQIAINDIDDFEDQKVGADVISFNNMIQEPARTELTDKQKILIVEIVAGFRRGVL